MSQSNKKPEKKVKPLAQSAKSNKKKSPKGILKEWFDAALFAAIAASLIRTFLIEAFVIPTASMERSLMVGDFLFVSKIHYGTRLPMVPLSMPFVHNKLPFSDTKSYLDWIVFPYFRLPGISSIKRNDSFVFNYPADDVHPNNPKLGPVEVASVKENYIKRCVAVPGDKLQIKGGQIYINDKIGQNPPEMQYRFFAESSPKSLLNEEQLSGLGFRPFGDPNENIKPVGPNQYLMFMPLNVYQEVKSWPEIDTIYRDQQPLLPIQSSMYPPDNFGFNMHKYGYTLDDFGPIKIPQKGATYKIDTSNIEVYRRCITAYENHKLEIQGEVIKIDGKPVKEYTFEMDYYFAMGDNRYNSQDSRYWGFVPEDHIVGKPIMVFFSKEGKIRWNRTFKLID